MAEEGKDFSIHTRQKTKGAIFYVQFRTPDGKFGTAKSSGIRDTGKKKDFQAAVSWAQNYMDTGNIISKERMTFESYAQDFFEWEGPFCQNKVMKGRRISQEQADKHAMYTRNHLIPYFGPKKLTDIDDSMIEDWQRHLRTKGALTVPTRKTGMGSPEGKKGLSGSTVNHATIALRLILRQAAKEKLIRAMPLVEAVAVATPKKGVFTPGEIRKLFQSPWKDFRFEVANKVAAVTGCRAGEIAALRQSHVHPEYLEINHTWDPKYGLGPTKTGKERIVPIPDMVHRDLLNLLAINPFKESEDPWLFFSADPSRPVDQSYATRALYGALAIIGIDEEARRKRVLNFHSWRHTFNSLLVAHRVPMPMVQSVTGHLTDEMTQRYFHVSGEALKEIRGIQDGILE
jgi:integrase